MPYIGKSPVGGGFHKLDNLTASATATYALTLGSAAYYPETANQLLVSLNGVIQAPQDSFTVSGSNLVFDSALTASDSIDFVVALGDVLGVQGVTDGAVTTAKIANDAVTAAKIGNGAVTSAKLDTNIDIAGTLDSTGVITADAGIKLGTGTDILNLYDEGTWTVENRSIASLTITNTQQAYYVRIGNLAFVNFYITYPSTSDSNNAKVSLPFTATGHSYLTGRTQFSGGDDGVVLQCVNGTSEAIFYRNESSLSAFTNANLSGNYILMSGCFYTTS